jgi:hypothetical protein
VPGHEDSNVDVWIATANNSIINIEFGYINEEGGFVSFFDVSAIDICERAASFYPGEVVEFAIRAEGGDVYSMVDFGSITYYGPVAAPQAYEPLMDEDYWLGLEYDFNAVGLNVTGSIAVDGSFPGDGMTEFKEDHTGVPTINVLTAIVLSLLLAAYALYHFTRRSRFTESPAE